MKAAVFAGSRNLYHDMVPAVKALLINSDVDIVYLLIEDDTFPEYLPECVKTINVSNQQFFRKDGPNMKSCFTYLAMMRGALAYLFPDLDRILAMDCDAIADRDISHLWDLPIDNYYLAAAREPARSMYGQDYINVGVCLYNLKKLRDGMADRVIELLNTDFLGNVEQDAFCYLCQGQIYILPSTYNSTIVTDPVEDPHIVHYCTFNDWPTRPLVQKYRAIGWDQIRGGI